jgi:hypothetical protein
MAFISSCEVEFNPNGSWKETTVVYGVLDQDADTNFVRIEKCFLGEGNYVNFSKVKDSVYYKEEELSVNLYAFYYWETNAWDTTKALEKIPLNYTETYKKDSGEFYYDVSPIYFTTHKLNSQMEYYLVIKNLITGNTTTSHSRLVADYKVTAPSGNSFGFNYNSTYQQYLLNCKWTSQTSGALGEMPKMFQPAIRFNFLENGQKAFVDLKFSSINNPFTLEDREISFLIFHDEVVSQIKDKVSKRGVAQRSFLMDTPTFEIFVYSCGENLKNYIDNNVPIVSLTERPVYSNIENGIGIFSSRRLNIKKSYTSFPDSFKAEIEGLNIGF